MWELIIHLLYLFLYYLFSIILNWNVFIYVCVPIIIIKLFIECYDSLYFMFYKVNENIRIDGKIVIITGSDSGLGKETALELARRGGVIYMACCNKQKSAIVRDEIIRKTGNKNVFNRHINLASMKSIRNFVSDFLKEQNRLDILINNAGVLSNTRSLTDDGFESHIGINHLGHLLLTYLLLDVLKNSQPSRIIIVSSIMYRFTKLRQHDFNYEKDFQGFLAYGQSKLANLMFTHYLALYFKLHKLKITANTCHPGIVRTNIARNFNRLTYVIGSFLFGLSARSGAQTQIRMAIDPTLENISGRYFESCKYYAMPKEATDTQDVAWLMHYSKKLMKIQHKI